VGRFERIESQRIYQQIVEQISNMIREGTLEPGDRLPPERQLAEEFGVSRAAVREALSALGFMGLVEVRAGEGTFVRSVTAEGLVSPLALLLTMERDEAMGRELLELRAALEAETAYLAAQRREEEDVSHMEAALIKMGRAMADGELGADADGEFHRAITVAAGNGLLVQVMRTLTDSMTESLRDYRERLLRIPAMDRMLLDEHQGILEAIRECQPDLAHDRMRAHIERVKRTLYGTTEATPKATR
jgi:GntR family transcriptional regulator, transcriptional repressor for pyruvate dehydrogenase complex